MCSKPRGTSGCHTGQCRSIDSERKAVTREERGTEERVGAKPVGVSPSVPLLGGLGSPGLPGRRLGGTHLLLDEGPGGPADGQQRRVAQRLPHREAAQQRVALRGGGIGRGGSARPHPGARAGGEEGGACPPAGRRRSSPGTGPCAAPGRSRTPPRAGSPGAAAAPTRRPAAWSSRSLRASRGGPGGARPRQPGAPQGLGGPARVHPDLFSPEQNSGGANELVLLVA